MTRKKSIDEQINDARKLLEHDRELMPKIAAFHAAYIATAQFHDFVLKAPFVESVPELKVEAEALLKVLEAFNEKIGTAAGWSKESLL